MERRFPLEVLVIGMHHHSPEVRTAALRIFLREHPAVRAYGSTQYLEEARSLALRGEVNTIFVDPWVEQSRDSLVPFIREIRRERPSIVFILYAPPDQRESLVKQAPELEHYFSLDLDNSFLREGGDERSAIDGKQLVDSVLRKCEEWHREQFQYDVAISFSGADREAARDLASALTEAGVSVFFDEFEEAELLGKDLYDHLTVVYSKRARYSLMLVSRSYAERAWPTLERRSMQERALAERGKEYVLPIRIDDTQVPGLLSTIGYVSIAKGARAIAALVCRKLWMVDSDKAKVVIGTSSTETEAMLLAHGRSST
jgi:hypothetical protein